MWTRASIILLVIRTVVTGQKDVKPIFGPPGGDKGLIGVGGQQQHFLNGGIQSVSPISITHGKPIGVHNGHDHGKQIGIHNGLNHGKLNGHEFNGDGFVGVAGQSGLVGGQAGMVAGIGGQGGIAGGVIPMERITKHSSTTEHHFGHTHDEHKKDHGHMKGNIGTAGIAGQAIRPLPIQRPSRVPVPVPYPVPRPVPIPITRTRTRTQPIPVPIPVRVPVPVTVRQPVPVRIPQPVQIPVPRPYPVHIPQPYPVHVNTGSQTVKGCGYRRRYVGGRCIDIDYDYYGQGYQTGYGLSDYVMAGLLGDSFDMGFRDNDFSDLSMLYLLRRRGMSGYGGYGGYSSMMGRGRRGYGMGFGYGMNYGYGGYGGYGAFAGGAYGAYGRGGFGMGGFGGGGGGSGAGGSGGSNEGGEGGAGGSGQEGYYWQYGSDNDD